MLLVSILKEAFSRNENDLSEADMFKPVSIMTSNNVGVIGPWPNRKALMASHQKKEADVSNGSFLTILDKDRFRHWPISYCSQIAL